MTRLSVASVLALLVAICSSNPEMGISASAQTSTAQPSTSPTPTSPVSPSGSSSNSPATTSANTTTEKDSGSPSSTGTSPTSTTGPATSTPPAGTSPADPAGTQLPSQGTEPPGDTTGGETGPGESNPPESTTEEEPKFDPALWSMRSHDVRRTGRTSVLGPRRGNGGWRFIASGGSAINMEPTVTEDAVYFGTWGTVRGAGRDKSTWDKFDGKIYALTPETGRPIWNPILPAKTPFAYKYDARPRLPRDNQVGVGFHLNYFNGTVEGTGAVDPKNGMIYFGRGDGVLYALDPSSSGNRIAWQFKTFDPDRPSDPEGGGEIVGGPLVTTDGMIIFGTFGAPTKHRPPNEPRIETNAVYALNRDGKLLWRYPARGGLDNAVAAPLALSPDGSRVYGITALLDEKFPCEIFALDRISGSQIWHKSLPRVGGQDIAVGSNGTIYVAGMGLRGLFGLGLVPVAFAIKDCGSSAEYAWGPIEVDGGNPLSHVAGGVALYEGTAGVEHLYISTTIIRNFNTVGGRLHRMDPSTGKITATWNPFIAKPSCVGGLTDVSLDNEGVIYVGVRGRKSGFLLPESQGRMYCLRFSNGIFNVLWSRQVDHQIDWASPAIGPDGSVYFGSTDTFSSGESFMNYVAPKPVGTPVLNSNPGFYCVRDRK